MQGLVRLVSGKHDGALKAEHGRVRNMAPFVAAEWGDEAYAIMRDLKSLFDPDDMLNSGVVINADARAHVTDLKPWPPSRPRWTSHRLRLLRGEVPIAAADDDASPADAV